VLKWVVSSAASNIIAAGTYQVLAVIDTSASAGTTGWNGTATSDVAVVQVNVTSTPTQRQIEQKLISEAIADRLLGNDIQAITALNQLLAQNPTSVRALQLKGAVLTDMGQTQAALDATQQALDNVLAQDPNSQEPPKLLLSAASSLRDQIFVNTSPQPVATTTSATFANVTSILPPDDQFKRDGFEHGRHGNRRHGDVHRDWRREFRYIGPAHAGKHQRPVHGPWRNACRNVPTASELQRGHKFLAQQRCTPNAHN
jgi:tetratricopeptide (TPR) repeat protein